MPKEEQGRQLLTPLTPRQQEILTLLRQGQPDEEIGRRIGMSPGGVGYHVDNVLRALGAESREALVDQRRPPSSRRFTLPVGKLITGVIGVVVVVVVAVAGALFALNGSSGSNASLGKLAYMMDGDLWVVEVANGEPVQLTNRGRYSSPAWSASGEWLSVQLAESAASSYIVKADGSAERFASGCSWSPVEDVMACTDGRTLRIETPEGDVVATYDLATMLDEVPDFFNFNASCLQWSNDGQYLACDVYAQREGVFRVTGAEGEQYDAIWVVAADGSSAREVLGADPIEADEYLTSLGWTDDDLSLVFAHLSVSTVTGEDDQWKDGFKVSIVPVSGGDPVAQDSAIVSRANFYGGRTPDGLGAFAVGEGRQLWTGKRIAVVDQESGSTTSLTNGGEAAIQPSWSPDYSLIAYVAAPDAGEIEGLGGLIASEEETSANIAAARAALAARRIWVMDRDGGNKLQLTDDPRFRDELPRWSEDSEHILFARIDSAGRPSVWLMNSDGSDPEEIAELSPCEGSSCYALQMQQDFSGPFWLGYYGQVPWFTQYAWWQPEPVSEAD